MSPGKEGMRVDVRLIFHRRSAIKCFKMLVGCSFQETLLCGTLPISLCPGLTDFTVVLNPQVMRWLSTGYKFSSTHFFRRESLLTLLSVKRAASYVAFKMVRCNVYVLCWCVFPHPLSFSCLWQGVETRFSVLSMQFRARHSRANNSLCYTIFCSHAWDVSCMLDYAAVLFVLRALLCAF